MKIIDVEQGTPEWLHARIGVLTASQMDQVITPKTLKPSASRVALAYLMLAEEMIGQPLDNQSSGFMQRGTALEAEARAWYSFERDVEVVRVGLITTDDGRAGCSPDGLVGDDGGVEIKCPAAHTHVGYLLDGPGTDYACQVQGSLWVTGRAWWDFVSYCPGMPARVIRYEADPAFQAALSAAAAEFFDFYDGLRARLHALWAEEQAA